MPWLCPSLPMLLVTPLVVHTMCHACHLCHGHAHCCPHALLPVPFVACALRCPHPSLPAPFITHALCHPRPLSPALCVTPLITHVMCHAHCLCHSRELMTFNKGLHTRPWTKKAGAPQSGFPLCLLITAVSFCTQPNSKNISFFLLQLYIKKQAVTTLSN